jgi:hypothetical protein
MPPDAPDEVLSWLRSGPSLEAMRARYPGEWQTLSDQLSTIFASGKPEALRDYMTELAKPVTSATSPAGRRALPRPRVEANVTARLVRQRMAHLALKGYLLSALERGKSGKLRFNWVNGFVAQKLLFARDLERKPVAPFWFNLFWPLLWQRHLLMPLVEPKGIYCFYARPLIEALARLIGARDCLEIAAGDGTLSRFLAAEGVKITATDDHSWKHAVKYPESVVKMDAIQALKRYRPRVVVCSWPPANNPFERQIFKQDEVELYIVIGSRHEFASGNWRDYRAQTGFVLTEADELRRWVLPPELGGTVYLFRRCADAADT